MRRLLFVVTIAAGCAGPSANAPPSTVTVAKAGAPRDSIEQERTGQTLERPPASMPLEATPQQRGLSPQQQVGPLRDIPPAPIVQ